MTWMKLPSFPTDGQPLQRDIENTLPPIIMVQWKMWKCDVSNMIVSFYLGAQFSTEPWLDGGNSNICFFSSLLGEDSHFDEHMFQMGWFNHQLDDYGKKRENIISCPVPARATFKARVEERRGPSFTKRRAKRRDSQTDNPKTNRSLSFVHISCYNCQDILVSSQECSCRNILGQVSVNTESK